MERGKEGVREVGREGRREEEGDGGSEKGLEREKGRYM